MTLGNVLALLQTNIKRLLAYSSIAHAGYMLIGIAVAYPLRGLQDPTAAENGVAAVLFYLVAYVAMTIGAFGVLLYLSGPDHSVEKEDELSGLSRSHPMVAFLMAIFLFSLIGIPLTGGFAGKLLLFWGALAEPADKTSLFRWLAVIGVLNSAIGAYYYLRILGKMYLHPSVRKESPRHNAAGLAGLWACAVVTLFLGVYPSPLMDQARKAAAISTAPAANDPLHFELTIPPS
jgi:NADH-quinone oxidoreductase subunit N